MTADLLALLDQLAEARAKGTKGQWYVHPDRPVVMYSDDASRPGIGSSYMPADAALIVAAVNKLPELTAALRAMADEAERMAYPGNEPLGHVTQAEHGERLLRILTAALTPESVPS